jgi:hypothetical protein
MNYKSKTSILALILGAGLSGGAFAQDWSNSGPMTTADTPSAAINLVAIDAVGAPVLTQPQRDAIAADANAAKFDSKTSKFTDIKTDSYTGDAHSQTSTLSGVKTGEAYSNTTGASGISASGVTSTSAAGDKSVFSAGGVTVVNTAGASSTVTAGGASFTDASGGNTTIAGGDVTSTGTLSGAKVLAGGRDVGQSLADHDATLAEHDTRITHVQNQADATDTRLNTFNGTGGSLEGWASGVDNWRADTNAWRGGVDNTLAHYGSEISALQNWQGVATAQIANLQSRMGKVEGAAAIAMTLQVPTLEAGKRFAFSGDFGGANNTGAFTVGTAIRLNDTWQLHAGGGTATNGQAWGGRVGVTGQW